jgi:KRAB domain-containing zinc finger protein
LKSHLREHAEEKAYRCRICDKVYQRTDTLRNHMMLHSNEWPFVCAQCGARFRHRLSYYRHIDSHKGRELFACQLCNKTFKHNNALNEHNRRFHQSTVTVLSLDLLANSQNVEYSVSVPNTVV